MTSEFDKKVYAATQLIPRGKVTTYARLAKAIKCGSPRAVGQSLKRNPFAPIVPCHRVIRSDLTIGGFSGATDGEFIVKKLSLLQEEGVVFWNGVLSDNNMLFDF
ncbi:MAG: MGMT family protein [Lentisphaerae bacterium]|jgi:methylated-DNA-[protein]-cysteine S-methyltransferase|nr:MGMT family protein [Lentisphaerota bacterium]